MSNIPTVAQGDGKGLKAKKKKSEEWSAGLRLFQQNSKWTVIGDTCQWQKRKDDMWPVNSNSTTYDVVWTEHRTFKLKLRPIIYSLV